MTKETERARQSLADTGCNILSIVGCKEGGAEGGPGRVGTQGKKSFRAFPHLEASR